MQKKQLKKKVRIRDAKRWVHDIGTENLPEEYAQRYSVNVPCAIKDLEKLGCTFSDEYKEKTKKAYQRQIEENRKRNLKRKRKQQKQKEELYLEQGEHYAFIAGYTSNGVPFGVTYEEMDELEKKFENDSNKELDLYYETFEESFVTESHSNYLEQCDYTKDFEDICSSLDNFYWSSSRQYYHRDLFHESNSSKGRGLSTLKDIDKDLPF